MSYKVVSILALLVVSALCLPYEPPAAIAKPAVCPCPKIYMPLCGSDGHSYSNICEFNCQARQYRKLYGSDMHVVKEERCEGSQ